MQSSQPFLFQVQMLHQSILSQVFRKNSLKGLPRDRSKQKYHGDRSQLKPKSQQPAEKINPTTKRHLFQKNPIDQLALASEKTPSKTEHEH